MKTLVPFSSDEELQKFADHNRINENSGSFLIAPAMGEGFYIIKEYQRGSDRIRVIGSEGQLCMSRENKNWLKVVSVADAVPFISTFELDEEIAELDEDIAELQEDIAELQEDIK